MDEQEEEMVKKGDKRGEDGSKGRRSGLLQQRYEGCHFYQSEGRGWILVEFISVCTIVLLDQHI